MYRDLVKNTQDDFEEERETNFASVLASLQTWGMEDVVRVSCIHDMGSRRSQVFLSNTRNNKEMIKEAVCEHKLSDI